MYRPVAIPQGKERVVAGSRAGRGARSRGGQTEQRPGRSGDTRGHAGDTASRDIELTGKVSGGGRDATPAGDERRRDRGRSRTSDRHRENASFPSAETCCVDAFARCWKWKRMESRSEHSPPEQQTWNPTYQRHEPTVRQVQSDGALTPNATTNSAVCAHVREQLNALLENDGSVRPETAAALYGHLAVCAACTHEFQAMQRVVHLLEALPLAELPTDYSRLVMHKNPDGLHSAKADRGPA